MSSRIKPLSKDVVNKIAAGEIILGPSNALKELLENSVDAGATQIDVLTKNGGLKLLQIVDNGCGINKDDMPILCERFTTSKLQQFEDLKSITTFGFRGEALASISHVARLTVTTKTREENCAYKASYLGGELLGGNSSIEPVAGKDGTVLLVEDLFYNVPSRLKALKSGNDEYARIVDVVNKYSIHINNVGFSCQRQDGKAQVDLMVRNGMNRKDRIRNIYGSEVTNNLLEFDIESLEGYGLIKCECAITNTDFDNKKSIQPVFFINNRLVVCDPLKRAIMAVYAAYLPKGHRPFIYMSLIIKSDNLDVNVHPTKREVRFLNEDEIIEYISEELDTKLASLDTSRKFMTRQVLAPKKPLGDEDFAEPQIKKPKLNVSVQTKPKSLDQMKKLYEHQMVRTDFKQPKLDSFLMKAQPYTQAKILTQLQPQTQTQGHSNEILEMLDDEKEEGDYEQSPPSSNGIISTETHMVERTPVDLASIKQLRYEVESRISPELTELFGKHTFVGVADYSRRLCCLQYDVNLYLVDYGSVLNEFFYQIALADFSNYGKIELTKAVNIKDLIKEQILNNTQFETSPLTDDELQDLISEKLVDMSDMWQEYFNITFEVSENEASLKTMPLLVSGYLPCWSKLALFIYKILIGVDFSDEQKCLAGILRQLSLLHVPAMSPERNEETLSNLENLLFPLIKKKFIATANLAADVIEIANLPGLYKVFERC